MTALARDTIASAFRAAVDVAAADLGWPAEARAVAIEVEHPADPGHGDYASAVALRLAKPLRRPPLAIAEAIRDRFPASETVASVEVAKPGFVNVRLADAWVARQVDTIAAAGEGYGRSTRLEGQRIQVEYISANPTGPMHVANARGGPIGDVLSNVLAFMGARVTREYYVNDTGSQVDQLGVSVALRYRELFGEKVEIPADAYPAEYVIDIATRIRELEGDRYVGMALEDQAKAFAPKALDIIVNEWHKGTARKLGIDYDVWYRESELVGSEYFRATIDELRARGALEERDGAVWLRSRELGEDIDSVVIRSNGVPTYFGVDLVYHRQCLVERGFDRKIDVWGANTYGHSLRMRAAMKAFGLLDRWEVVIYQYVRFLHEGEILGMSKRRGQFILLDDVIDRVGRDVARWFFLQSSPDRMLDFDLELAVTQSSENPAYYVQYAHARIASIFGTAAERGLSEDGADVALLTAPAEADLVKALLRFPEVLDDVLARRASHLLAAYALDLAGRFHSYYRDHRVVGDDPALSRARLRLVRAVQVTLRQVLGLLGISAPDHM
ncbi:MAG: arginine--tRNA ligase [Chloroflexota bacterium]|nr:arginine--tRNA ligase [Chloroflexota bacterium]MDE3193588.1 arginine--tRNA ligase [Chloroflexota bacterium]